MNGLINIIAYVLTFPSVKGITDRFHVSECDVVGS